MNNLRGVLAVVVGIVSGSLAMTWVHELGMQIWPEAPYPTEASPAEMQVWMNGLRLETKLFATVAHWTGTAIAALLAMMVSAPVRDYLGRRERRMWPAWTLGGWFLVGGIANAWMLGTPAWLTALDLIGYLPVAYLIGRGCRRLGLPETAV